MSIGKQACKTPGFGKKQQTMKYNRVALLTKPILSNNPQLALQILVLFLVILSTLVYNMIVMFNIIFTNHR